MHSPCKGAHPGLQPPMAQPTASEIRCSERQETWPAKGTRERMHFPVPPPRIAEEQRAVAWRVSPVRIRIPVQGRRSEESEQGSVKMEEQGPRRPIRRESLESKGKRSPAGQVETFGDLLPQADLRQIKQEPEEEEELKQHWDAQWQDFLKTMQPPCSSWETPQAPIPPHSGDGVFLTSFKGATDDSQWPSGRAGETDQTLFPDTEGLLGKQGSVKMEEQGPRRPIRRESLESKGKRSPAGQVETFGDLLPQADLRQIKQEPEEEEELKQHWDAQWQDFLKTMQPPCSSWETPQAPIPPHSGDGVFLTSFKGATDDSQWPSGRAGETDQTLFPDTEGLLGKQGSVKMEEQGPRRPIRRESLESKGKRSPAGQVETFGDLLPQADLRQIKQEPEEEEELKQHWDAQWQDFLKTMQPPCSSWETPQAPIPPHSGDGVFLSSFKAAADDSQWPSGRTGETDQTLFPDTEGLLGKETTAARFGTSRDIKLTSNCVWSKQETLVDQWLCGLTVPTAALQG
ncbi:uncharacterized protein LOC118090069 isoform X18 [Zootoca vivipara]|uniref:uncharacterized protein LOC118090069 isoform X18 n=1 Tax=Zootoca vivipara TaxID=8524 RepID=UPI00293BC000|nr:uncharacterized protein LOC118090069 isoform X18 [Zootoca vivipara]